MKAVHIVAAVALLTVVAASETRCEDLGRDYPYVPVPFTAVKVDGGFWGPRLDTNREVTVWYDFHKCEETGRIENFSVAGGLKEGGFQGIYFNDSDVFKVIEGASYALALQPDKKLDDYLDTLIAKIAAAQENDGYLYTARTISDPKYNFPGKEGRWSHLGHGHELYNVGHMYEAAVAHCLATGNARCWMWRQRTPIWSAKFSVKGKGRLSTCQVTRRSKSVWCVCIASLATRST